MRIMEPVLPREMETAIPLEEALAMAAAYEEPVYGYAFAGGSAAGHQLEKTEYKACIFTNCRFTGAALSGAWFQNAVFENCDLSGAKLLEATLQNTFFMRRDYDADAQPNASGAQYNFKIKDAGKWTKVVVYYDMGQVVNAISSKKSNPALEVSDTDDDAAILKDCYVAILGQNKGGVVEISDVTLKKK